MELGEFSIQTNRLTLSGYKNKVSHGSPVIALHGWLDNAASFVPLSGFLQTDRPFYALEMPGHGLSEHRPRASNYHLVDNILDIIAFIQAISNEKVTLIGHSLGGIVCSLVAAAAPEYVDKLILLDSLGPLTDETKNVLPQLRKAVAKYSSLKPSKKTVYPNKEQAALLRMSGVGKVGREGADLLVDRGLEAVSGGYQWTSDPQLLNPSLLRFTEAQIKAIFTGIECPVCLIVGKQGYFSSYESLKIRLCYIKQLQRHEVNGGHHFHMDGDVLKTAELVNVFLES